MEQSIDVHGCVIKHRAVGEYDWAVTLLTAERGKISAFARSARRPSTKLSGNVEPLSFGTFSLFPGRNSYVITDARIDRYFEDFRKDLEKAAYGSFFLEVADYYTRENMEAADFLNLLYVALRALESADARQGARFVRCVFEIRAMVTEGIFPGADAEENASPVLVKTLRHIAEAPLQQLYAFSLRNDVLDGLDEICDRFRARCMDIRPKSLEMIAMYED